MPIRCAFRNTIRKQFPGRHNLKKIISTMNNNILVRRTVPKPTPVFDTYWRFAAERQNILMKRLARAAWPWTDDPILAKYKFTNVYRVTDRVSQYLVAQVIGADERDLASTMLRILLFKLFNKIETWELLEDQHGEINARTFQAAAIKHTLDLAVAGGASIYSAAYIMPSGPADVRQTRKHWMHLLLLAGMLANRIPEQLAAAPTMMKGFARLREIPGFGPFLAYQYATDLAYSRHFCWDEMEFVEPGPGARSGLAKCFEHLGDYSEAETIRLVTESQDDVFERLGLQFQRLWARPLQLIDCQNIFCETDKYARVAHPEMPGIGGRAKIKQKFVPTAVPAPLVLPRKWQR